jgi:hypothetical protein
MTRTSFATLLEGWESTSMDWYLGEVTERILLEPPRRISQRRCWSGDWMRCNEFEIASSWPIVGLESGLAGGYLLLMVVIEMRLWYQAVDMPRELQSTVTELGALSI